MDKAVVLVGERSVWSDDSRFRGSQARDSGDQLSVIKEYFLAKSGAQVYTVGRIIYIHTLTIILNETCDMRSACNHGVRLSLHCLGTLGEVTCVLSR